MLGLPYSIVATAINVTIIPEGAKFTARVVARVVPAQPVEYVRAETDGIQKGVYAKPYVVNPVKETHTVLRQTSALVNMAGRKLSMVNVNLSALEDAAMVTVSTIKCVVVDLATR